MAAAGSRAGRGEGEGRGGAGGEAAAAGGRGLGRQPPAGSDCLPCPRRSPGEVPPLWFLVQLSPPFVPLCPTALPLRFPGDTQLSFLSPAGHHPVAKALPAKPSDVEVPCSFSQSQQHLPDPRPSCLSDRVSVNKGSSPHFPAQREEPRAALVSKL